MATCLLEDRDGNVWIGTKAGASRYDGERGQRYLPVLPLRGAAVVYGDLIRAPNLTLFPIYYLSRHRSGTRI